MFDQLGIKTQSRFTSNTFDMLFVSAELICLILAGITSSETTNPFFFLFFHHFTNKSQS